MKKHSVREKSGFLLFLSILGLSLFSFGESRSSLLAACSLKVEELRVEYLKSPQGLDEPIPRFSWLFKAVNSNGYGLKQSAYQIQIFQKSFSQETLAWNSDWVSSSRNQLIEYGGTPLQSDTNYEFKVRIKDRNQEISDWSEPMRFSTGFFDPEKEWSAQWIGCDVLFDRNIGIAHGDCNIDDPWFRKTFELPEIPGEAAIYVASVGYHELYVNGKRIGENLLAPCVSDHTKRARYVKYDIQKELRKGKNAVAIWLGTSWSIFPGYQIDDLPRTPIVSAQGILKFENGEPMRIATDTSWKTHPSPNRLLGTWDFRNMGGEIYDMSKEVPDWNLVDFDDSSWKNAIRYTPKLKLSAEKVEVNRKIVEIKPVAVEKKGNGEYRVDMGVNFAGWTEIKLKGKPGRRIDILFSEREQDKQTFRNVSALIPGESGEGVFKNRFNYSSGRWITLQGLEQAPELEDVKGWMVRTDFDSATTFECSDLLQNWIYDRVRWTFENLSLGGFIVDCPQRERMGYGGDAHATSETGMYNYKLGAFYTKWLEDWRDVQGTEPMVGNMNDPNWARKGTTSGRILGGGIQPHTAPTYWGGGGPAWGGICVSLPWFFYDHYADTRVLEQNIGMIEKWLEFLDSHVNEEGIMQRFGGTWDFLGDWLWPNATAEGMNNDSPQTLCLNNCFRVFNLDSAAKIAAVLGDSERKQKWEKQAEFSRKAIQEKFFNAEKNDYADGSMVCLAAALLANIPPDPESREKVMQRLENEILVVRKGHIHVGITGGAILFKVLRDEGRNDLIDSMVSKTTYPSWGFMKESGATTIWEMWEKDLPGHSLLHSSYLYPGAWYVDGIGGIRRGKPGLGFNDFVIRPPRRGETGITWAKTSYDSPCGTIFTYWKDEKDQYTLEVVVPPNTTATILVPCENKSLVSESSGKTLSCEENREEKKVQYRVESGTYRFTVKNDASPTK